MFQNTPLKSAKDQFHEATALFNNKKYQEAIALFSRLLDYEPANPSYLLSRGKCWKELNLFTFALWDLNDAFELFTKKSDQKICKEEIEIIEKSKIEFSKQQKEIQDKILNNLPDNFTPLFDKAIFLHLFYNYTKLNSEVPVDTHIEDLPRIKIRQLCQSSDLRPDLPPSYKLNDLFHLTRDLDHISLVVNFNNTKSQITENELEKFNQINGENAAEDLIEMLRQGIEPPTRAGQKKILLSEFEKIKKTKKEITKEIIAEKIKKLIDIIPPKYAYTRFKLYNLLELLT